MEESTQAKKIKGKPKYRYDAAANDSSVRQQQSNGFKSSRVATANPTS